MAFILGQVGRSLRLEMGLDGEVQVSAALTKLLKQAGDFSPAWLGFTDKYGKVPGAEQVLREGARQMFEQEGKPQYPWADLTDATNRARMRMGYPAEHPILYNTGGLMDSLILRSHPDHIFEHGRQWMEFGTKVPHAYWHQRPQAKKRRPMVYIRKLDFLRLLNVFRKHLRNIGAVSK